MMAPSLAAHTNLVMSGLAILSENVSRETHLRNGRPIQHRSWVIRLDGLCYYVSWLSISPAGEAPECAAFPSDEKGCVFDWEELAFNTCPNPRTSLIQIIDELRSRGYPAAEAMRLECA